MEDDTRYELWSIEEKVKYLANLEVNPFWVEADNDLAKVEDMLDVCITHSTVTEATS